MSLKNRNIEHFRWGYPTYEEGDAVMIFHNDEVMIGIVIMRLLSRNMYTMISDGQVNQNYTLRIE